jgi:hypothetical protein
MMTDHGAKASSTTMPGTPGSDQARGMSQEMKGAAADVAREARAAGEAVREEASGIGSTIKQGLSEQVERQKNGIADRLSAVAERAHQTAGDLRGQEAWLGGLLGRGADELAGIADEMRRNDVAGLMGSVEVFARRQPALFMGATVALGFALTRFVSGGPTPADGQGAHERAAVGGRAFEFARTPSAGRPTADAAVGGSGI